MTYVPVATVAVVRSPDFLAHARKGDRAYNIDPPTSPCAITQRACLYRGENRGPGKDDRGELDTQTLTKAEREIYSGDPPGRRDLERAARRRARAFVLSDSRRRHGSDLSLADMYCLPAQCSRHEVSSRRRSYGHAEPQELDGCCLHAKSLLGRYLMPLLRD